MLDHGGHDFAPSAFEAAAGLDAPPRRFSIDFDPMGLHP